MYQDYGLKNLRTIHRLDRLTSGLLMFGRSPARAREMETQIRTRQVHSCSYQLLLSPTPTSFCYHLLLPALAISYTY